MERLLKGSWSGSWTNKGLLLLSCLAACMQQSALLGLQAPACAPEPLPGRCALPPAETGSPRVTGFMGKQFAASVANGDSIVRGAALALGWWLQASEQRRSPANHHVHALPAPLSCSSWRPPFTSCGAGPARARFCSRPATTRSKLALQHLSVGTGPTVSWALALSTPYLSVWASPFSHLWQCTLELPATLDAGLRHHPLPSQPMPTQCT